MFAIRLFLLLLAALSAPAAHAFVRTMSDAGSPLFWANPQILLQGNPTNASGLSENDVALAFGPAFGAWAVPGSRVALSYSQSTSYAAGSGHDGANRVYFATAGGRQLGYGVVAVTEVLYYVASGQIVEADMAFNDRQFLFTNTEGDTGRIIGGKTAIYLRDVATHEGGHVVGVDHSVVNLSSMIYTAFGGQYSLTGDDQSAARTAYPAGGPRVSFSGRVVGTNGGIFGAHVAAVDLATGKVAGGALAGPEGTVRVGDLAPGTYAFLGEPFGTDVSSISSYFQQVNHRFCNGFRFRRTFLNGCGSGRAALLSLADGASASFGTIAPSCSQMGNAGAAPTTLASAREMPATGGALAGTIRPGESHYFRVRGVSGDLVARAIAYAIYSPVDLRVEILGAAAQSIGAQSVDNSEDPLPGGKVNYDPVSSATVPAGDYVIRVTAAAQPLSSSAFAAGFDLKDNDGHYLLSLSVDGAFGPEGAADMSSCASVNNSSQRATFRAPASQNQREESGGGCGSLGQDGGSGPGGGLVPFLALLALGHLAAFAARLVRRRA